MSTPIEPGILKIFRWYVGIRVGLLMLVALANRGDNPPDPPQFPAVGIVLFGLLFVILMVPAVEKRLARSFLPIAIAMATVAPIADVVANIAGRLDAGLSPNDALVDYWLPFFLLFIPFIITAWQYRYRWVVVFAFLSTVVEMVAISAVLASEEAQVQILGALLAARGLLFAFLGFFISKLVARQRDLRAELEGQAAVREQLATGRERNRLARELHDTLAHSMTATAVQLEAAQALWDDDRDGAREHVDRALGGTRSGLAEARRAIEELRASPLEERGLVGALEWLAEETSATSQAFVHLIAEGDYVDLSPRLEETIYRVAKEAIVNAVRHGAPTQIVVTVDTDPLNVYLTVVDDGAGFDPSIAIEDGHHGLRGMNERADLLDGNVTVDSQPGEGATVVLTAPRS